MSRQVNLYRLVQAALILALAPIVIACQGNVLSQSKGDAPEPSTLTPTIQPAPTATSTPLVAASPTTEPVPLATLQRNSGQALSGNADSAGMGGETTATPEPAPDAQASPEDENVAQSSADTSDPLFIGNLRRHRDDPPPTIEIVAPLVEDEHFTRYQIAYTSDGLRITGVMNVPTGDVPEQGFPVILLNHGYYSPASYTPGTGTQREADYLAHHGYVTIASDYRGYAGSEGGFGSHFDPGWTYDILDLLDALPSLDLVDPNRVGMWGHSTGGEIALRVITARDTVDATVLFGSMGADAADNFRLVQGWGGGHAVAQRYGTPEEAPEVWARLSPITYLADVAGPISIHHGELDGEVPPELSARLWEAMQAASVPGEYYTYPGQRHIFRGDAWEQAMERTLTFFDRCGPQPLAIAEVATLDHYRRHLAGGRVDCPGQLCLAEPAGAEHPDSGLDHWTGPVEGGLSSPELGTMGGRVVWAAVRVGDTLRPGAAVGHLAVGESIRDGSNAYPRQKQGKGNL